MKFSGIVGFDLESISLKSQVVTLLPVQAIVIVDFPISLSRAFYKNIKDTELKFTAIEDLSYLRNLYLSYH